MSLERRISRRTFFGHCLTGAAAFGLTPSANSGEASTAGAVLRKRSEQRNVLLLISDDQGLDQCGCYGNGNIQTPNLDRLAAGGVKVTNAFATSASCSASRSVILSGLFNHRNAQYGHEHDYHHFRMFDWVRPLPALLRNNGYATGVIGKLHVGPQQSCGFDFVAPGRELWGNRNVYQMAKHAGEFFNQDSDKPFFLLVGYSDPHRAAKGFANDREYPGIKKITYSPSDVTVPYFLPDCQEVREELAEQYQAVSRMDQGVGLVIEELRKSGRYDETLIIYISDNGIPFPGAKTTLYDPGVHLPMIVQSPTLRGGGRVNDAMISFVDITPTVLEWTRTPPPDYELHGRSFLSILGEERAKGWDRVFVSHTFHEITMYYPTRGIRTRRFKYLNNLFPELEFPPASDLYASASWQAILRRKDGMMGKRTVKGYLHRDREELYDLSKDPEELKNAAGDPPYAEVLNELRQEVLDFRKRTNDAWLILRNYEGQKV
jgi:N-sulfoglucosamine sulfohydrolase